MRVDITRPKTRYIYRVYKKINVLNFSGELDRQQCSKMSISYSLFILWMQISPFWKAYKILYNFHLEHIPRFWCLFRQKQMTSSTAPDFWQHRNINLQQLYLTIRNRYRGDSRANRKVQKSTYLHKIFMTIEHPEHEICTDKGGLLRMIQNWQQDKKKPNYLFISSLSLNLRLNDCGHAHKSLQSCQKSKSNIVHHNNHPTTQVTIVQPLKIKETKHTLAHLCVFITYFCGNPPMGQCWC